MFKKLELKKHALTAISYMLPLVVASGLLIAIGNLTGGGVIEDYSAPYTWSDALTSLGVMGMGLLPPFIAGYVSYSIADRPGLAPGFLMGCIAKEIGAGFLGGMLGGIPCWLLCSLAQTCDPGSEVGRRSGPDDDYSAYRLSGLRSADVLCHRCSHRLADKLAD